MPAPWIKDLRKDVVGGLMSSTLAIPLALGYGMFVFITLGDEYFAQGARAGLISAFVGAVVCVLLGARDSTIYAPRITTTFFLGLLLNSLVHSTEPALQGAPASLKLLVLFAIILLAGLLQALFGLLKLGTLIKFAPHPVMAGFQNMAALLLFLVQLVNVLGYDHSVPLGRVFGHLAETKPLSVAVAALTFAAMWYARRITTTVPPLLVGLAIGIAAYYSLILAGMAGALGPTIGIPDANIMGPRLYTGFADPAELRVLAGLSHIILPGALALAIIASIDGMLCAKLASAPGAPRGDSNRLLVRLGVANAASAVAGGITSGINIGASVTNRTFGGRSWVSVMVNAVLLLATILVLLPLVTHLPRAVLSAVIMVVAVQHIDPWSKQATARLFKDRVVTKGTLVLDLGIALLVSILSIAVNIVLAVFLGFFLAVLLFVLRMSRSNIRRHFRGDTVRSRKARSAKERKVLGETGNSILILELQGALFFGSAEWLARKIEAEAAGATQFLILDLRRVTEIDSTGVHILAEVEADLARRGIRLTLVLHEYGEIGLRLLELSSRRLPDVDRAIELAEDDLLGPSSPSNAPESEIPYANVSLLRDFTADQIARFGAYLERMQWPPGSTIFKEGDPGSHLFLVTRGHASVRLMTKDGDIRLATFAPGTAFGELAILDHGPRSATVSADDELTTWALSVDGFNTLQRREPDLAIRLLSALGRELSGHLRQANLTIHQLEA
jgi:sulfate permease, SulP family